MASINQIVSEIANALQQPTNVPLREAIRLSIIHVRSTLIRHSFEQHKLVDKVLQQRFRISLIDCPDGDINIENDVDLGTIKRSAQRVPRPIRLSNGLPFLSVRTVGMINPIEIAYAPEASSKFYNKLPGFCPFGTYDYINQYLYINLSNNANASAIESVIVEAPFEYPIELTEEHHDGNYRYDDDDEFIISEDIIYDLKKLVFEELGQAPYETNEIPTTNLVK